MPIHDWTRVDAGIFHHFHQAWTIELANTLNGGGLPSGYFAMAEQVLGGPIPDVVTLQRFGRPGKGEPEGGVAIADAPPRARYVSSAEPDSYAKRTNTICIRHDFGEVVAVIEIVSPGNKGGHSVLPSFVEKVCNILVQGIHLLIVDLFPPTPRDPQGIHKAIWDQLKEEPFTLPPDKPLTVVAYSAGMQVKAYVEPVAVVDPLPAHPIFLNAIAWVPAPLEATYQSTWDKCPGVMREAVAGTA